MAIITASPKNMARMIELQESSLGQLDTIRQIFERNMGTGTEQTSKVLKPSQVDADLLEVQKESVKIQKEDVKLRKEQLRQIDADAEIISSLAESFKTFKSPLERLGDGIKGMTAPLKTPGRTAMKALNVGGIFDKKIARSEFMEKQKDLGSTKTDKELKADFEKANKISKELKANEAKLEALKKSTGLSESKLAQTSQGRTLLDNRAQGSAAFKEVDLGAQLTSGGASAPAPSALASSVGATPTTAFANSAVQEEAQMENARLMDDQTTLLEKIEANTRGEGSTEGGDSAGGGGGLMGGIGAGLKTLGGGLGSLGKGLGKGIQGLLTGIAKGIAAFGNAKVLLGAGAMVILSGALFITSKALQGFADVEWEDVAKGMASLAGIGVIGALAGTAAPLLIAGAAALGLLGGALWVIGEAMQAVGAGFQSMTDGLERLANLDGGNLSKVGSGLIDLGAGMAVFGAGQAAAGLGTLVSNLLTIGQDSPVEQLIKIGNVGEGLVKASVGVKDLAEGMKAFAGIDSDSLEALDEFPWRKATEFVKAGGVIKMNGAVVASASAAADMAKVDASGGSGGGTTVINAPVSNSSNTTQTMPRSPARSSERSWWNW